MWERNIILTFVATNTTIMRLTTKPYTLNYVACGTDYGMITVPAGTRTTNMTSLGIDPAYNFVTDTSWVEPVDGIPQYGLLHDLQYYGLNVPEEYFQ